jgi:hypothetical protein
LTPAAQSTGVYKVKKPLERWTEAEREALLALVREDLSRPADEVAALFAKNHPRRGLDAIKQRVFKMRREGLPAERPASAQNGSSKVLPRVGKPLALAVPATVASAPASAKVVPRELGTPPRELMTLELPNKARLRGTPEQVLAVLRGLDA